MSARLLVVVGLGAALSGSAQAQSKEGVMDQVSEEARRIGEAAALARQHKYPEAIALLDARPFTGELELPALLFKAQLLERADLESWPLYESAMKRFPDHPTVNLRAAVSIYRRGDPKRAEQLLQRSWHAAPMPETAYYLGRIYGASGRVDRAGEYFAKCIALEQERGSWRSAAETALAALEAKKPLPPEPR